MTDWQPRAAAYADQLVADAVLIDPTWQKVFATTPRHLFVPRYWALDEYNSLATLISGDDPDQRDTWLDAVYSDRFLVTQWAPSTTRTGRPIHVVTSSASQPCTVAVMLDRLAVQDGHTVLEIGTGTGYNAALLCARVGDDNVTSIDIDPGLVRDATASLTACGYRPRVHTGNGATGSPRAAPFDRIIATCSVDHIPPAWVHQLAPGGRLVAPLSFGGALAVLDKTVDHEVSGHIDTFTVYFMSLRETIHQPKPTGIAPGMPDKAPTDKSHHGHTDVDPRELDDPDVQLWLSLHLPGVHFSHTYEDGTPIGAIVYTAHDRADTHYQATDDGLWPVTQQGNRPWDTVEAAMRAWNRNDRPDRSRLGITARRDGAQHLWLDAPSSPHTWPPPTL
ncbi:MAG: methyltransferase domain-containing protein [Pseudonocardia sp.]